MTEPVAPSSIPAAPLVGRERERRALRDALAAAEVGRGSLVLIGGEAGIGKTTLAESLLSEALARGALVLVGRCYDLSETPPYGPWAEALSRTPRESELPPPPDLAGSGVTSQAALFAAVREYLAALTAHHPLVLLLDDLHWADQASLDLLRFLARQLHDLPILISATYRTDELTRRHALYQLLPVLVREARAARLDLHPLDASGLRALVAARHPLPPADEARLVDHLVSRAEGNPFFTGELLRFLEEAALVWCDADGWHLGDLRRARTPPLLRQVIDARLVRFDVESQRLLAIAAVIGHEIPLAVWASVGGRDEDAVLRVAERALEARLLVDATEGAGVQFAHALVREALYESIPALHRRRVHLRVGEALAAARHPDPDAVAYQFQRAGDDRAVAWLLRAGERAQVGYAWQTAAERFAAALALMEAQAAAAGERGWLLLRLGLLNRYHDYRRALAYVERAQERAIEAGDPLLAAYVRFTEGLVRCYLGELQQGVAAMEEGVAALDARFPVGAATRRRLEALGLAADPDNQRGTLARTLAFLGSYRRARALGEAVAARNPTIPATAALDCGCAADAIGALGEVYAALGRPEAARDAYRRAREAYRRIGDHFQVLATARYELRDLALPYRADDLAGRRRLADEISEYHAKMLSATFAYSPAPDLSPLLLLEGRWGDDLAPALLRAAAAGWPATWAAWMLGILARERGEPDDAWARVREALPDGPATSPEWRKYRDCLAIVRLAVRLALDAGEPATARAWLETHDRWLAWNGAVLGRSEGQALWAAYHRATGNARRAREHADRALAHASDPRQPLALLAAHRLLGELGTEARRYTDAAGHLERALALAEACAAPYERALTLLSLAELHAAAQDPVAARVRADEALAICRPLRAKLALARGEALAARLTAAIPRPHHPAGLTWREVEVLRLVAAGYTNRQIADRLSLTEKTVKNHMTHILTKIDAGNRAAAVGFALRHGLA